MVKLKRALGRSKEELSLSSRSNLFSSSTSIHSSASTAREARRREREADTPEINFAESDNRRDLDESPAGINRERLGNVVVEKFASTPPHHPFGVSPLPAYLVANETLDGRSLTNSYMRHVALL